MIPRSHLTQWANVAPWPDIRQVEQDLIICRALCDLFNHPELSGKLAFRGGTAINKLLFRQPLRYSEDIDLVQIQAEPIGTIVDHIRDALGWLGRCNRDHAQHSMHMVFKFQSEVGAGSPLKLKIEINTREHTTFLGHQSYPFEVRSDWYQATTAITSFHADELFATKLRALLQRNKSRDLFDLHEGLVQLSLDCDRLVGCFLQYMQQETHPISRAVAEERMLKKLAQGLTTDITPLLPRHVAFDEAVALRAFEQIWAKLIVQIPGDPWRKTPEFVQSLRALRYPNLLDPIAD